MTQGNCCRMAVCTRPDFAHQGRTRPPPRPPRPPRHPPPTSSLASRASLRRSSFPRSKGLEGRRRRGPALGVTVRGRGRRRGGQGSRSLGLGLPRPWGAPGPPPAFSWSFVLFLPTTCLSSGSERAQRKSRHSRRVSPSASEGRFWVREEVISSSPSLPPLFSFVASTLGYDTVCCFPPSHLGV